MSSSLSGITADKVSGKSKATVISSNFARYQRCDVWGGGGFQLNVTMTLFWKIVWRRPLTNDVIHLNRQIHLTHCKFSVAEKVNKVLLGLKTTLPSLAENAFIFLYNYC